MDGKELRLVSEKAECLHAAALIQGPDGLRNYGLPTDTDNCLECGWRAFEQACGKRVELPSVQIFYWTHSDNQPAHWVAESMPMDLIPDVPSVVGRGKTPGSAMLDLANQITYFLSRQPQ